MWFSFWRSRNRFTLYELRYLTDELQKIQVVNEVNKDFVIEALRSIAELVTYGDQNAPSFFEFFMEKQIMGEFARILNSSRPAKVALQLLQTMSIMIQNLSDHAIHYIFSNEHTNYLITYSFDFRNDELLSYYISFLRAISGKLNKNTISLLVKTKKGDVISFPLYVEAIRFAFHEENMVRIAVRSLTLNVYHVGDEKINKYVSRSPHSDYFSNMIKYFRRQCLNLDEMVAQNARNPDSADSNSSLLSAVDEIEDNLYYFSDVISAGVPDLGKVITDNLLEILIFPLLFPSLEKPSSLITGTQLSSTTALFLLCCVLHILKNKDLAGIVAAALFFPPEAFAKYSEATPNGHGPAENLSRHPTDQSDSSSEANTVESGSFLSSSVSVQSSNSSSQNGNFGSDTTLRKTLLSNIVDGDDSHVFGSLCLMATLLQTKELDESMLDALGILPQRKKHKKLLLQALVGEDTSEEQLYFSSNGTVKDNMKTELDRYLLKFRDDYKVTYHPEERELSPKSNRYQVLDALVNLLCRSDLPAAILWLGGWLIRQLLPHVESEFTTCHVKLLKDSHDLTVDRLLMEIRGTWRDVLIDVLKEEWRSFRRAFETSSPPRDLKFLLLSKASYAEGESSFAAAERMYETVKVFVLQRQLLLFSNGGTIPDMPPLSSSKDSLECSPSKTSGLILKPGSEVSIENALPCRIAFERGKEHHFCFLATSLGISGCVILAEQSPVKQQYGVVRVTAPLAGSDPRIDEKHPKWLHLRIRPLILPSLDQGKLDVISKGTTKVVVDGRWTLAFGDEQSCKAAESMTLREIDRQGNEVEQLLKPLLTADDTSSGFASRPENSLGNRAVELVEAFNRRESQLE